MARRIVIGRLRLVLIAVVIGLFAWRQWRARRVPPAPPRAPAVVLAAPESPVAPKRDLAADEARGGHTLARHVARTDDELRRRLREEEISAASTYTDRESAERSVGRALSAGGRLIEAWLARPGDERNLTLDDPGDGATVGRSLRRGAAGPVPCTRARVVLKRDRAGWFVLTAYPEAGT